MMGPGASLRNLLFLYVPLFGMLTACGSGGQQDAPGARRTGIGYELWTPGGDSLDHARWSDLVHRLGPQSKLLACWSDWPSAEFQDSLLAQVRRTPCPVTVYSPTGSADSSVLARFDGQHPGILSLRSMSGKANCNFMVLEGIAPRPDDDGRFGLLFMTGGEAVWMHGDSMLCMRFKEFAAATELQLAEWEGLESHTYSNLHDHWVRFFPDPEANGAATQILEQLHEGLLATRKPTKIRLALSSADACHAGFASILASLANSLEVDVRVVLGAAKPTSAAAMRALRLLPGGDLRWAYPDSTGAPPLRSNFMVVDGPMALEEGAPPESRRLAYFFSSGLQLPGMRTAQGAWLRIASRELAIDLEAHFDRIWDAATDSLPPARSLDPARCR